MYRSHSKGREGNKYTVINYHVLLNNVITSCIVIKQHVLYDRLNDADMHVLIVQYLTDEPGHVRETATPIADYCQV